MVDIPALPTYAWASIIVSLVIGIFGAAAALLWAEYGPEFDSTADRSRRIARTQIDRDDVDEVYVADGGTPLEADLPEETIELDPPRFKSAKFGLIGQLYQTYVFIRNRERLVSDGYVQWYLFDGTFPSPRWIKPTQNGEGIPSYKHDGEEYLFPSSAMVPSERQGAWTVMHRKGNADPINPDDQDELAIPADALADYLSRGVTVDPPGLFANINAKVLLYGCLGILIILVMTVGALQMGVI